LHPTALRFVASRAVAALGSDGNSDTAPSTPQGVSFPIRALATAAIGLHLLDYLQFEDLILACERAQRREFLFITAPLRIVGGSGSPINPLAVL
jgi:kynurenine formamidase